MLNRDQAIEIAKRKAREFKKAARISNSISNCPLPYTYLHNADMEDWMPHEWVIAAIMEAGDREFTVTEIAQAVKDSGIGFKHAEEK